MNHGKAKNISIQGQASFLIKIHEFDTWQLKWDFGDKE